MTDSLPENDESELINRIIRRDETALNRWQMTISQSVSVFLLVVAVALWCWVLRNPVGRYRLVST